MPSVSFVVTFYNKGQFVDLVLDAIKGQAGIDQAEYIFVDDGSTDDTLEKLRKREAEFDNIKIITIENSGPGIASNTGIFAASMDYIKMVDGDDLLHPEATISLIKTCETHGTGIAFGELMNYNPADLTNGWEAGFPELDLSKSGVFQNPISNLIDTWQINPTQLLVKTAILQKAGGADARVFVQDVAIGLRLSQTGPFALLKGPVGAFPEWAHAEPTKVTANEAQVLHDVSFSTAFFMRDYPAVETAIKKRFLRKLWGRGWKWAKRRGGRSILSKECFNYIRARLGLLPPTYENFAAACKPFRETTTIRIPPEGQAELDKL